MRKVCIIIDTLLLAGAQKFVVDLALAINKEKFNPVVAVTAIYTQGVLLSTLLSNGIEVVDLSHRTYLGRIKNIYKFFKKNKFDIVHVNTSSLLVAMWGINKCKIPVRIFTFHSTAERAADNSKIKKFLYKRAFNKYKFVPVGIDMPP